MGLLDRLRVDFPHPAWRYSAPGALWQIQVGSPLFLLGEARNQEKKSLFFFSIDRITGKAHWEGVNPVESWWAGVEGVFGQTVLFHGFATPDLPIHKGIFAVDGLNGSVLWSAPDLRFLWCNGGIVGATTLAGESREIRLDLKSGQSPAPSPTRAPLPAPVGEGDEPAIYPASLDQITGSNPGAGEIIRRAIRSGIGSGIGSAAALLAGGSVIVEYAEPRAGSTDMHPAYRIEIVEIDRATGRRRFTGTVLSDSPNPLPEPFFVQREMLFYVADRTTLVALPLRKP